MKLLKEDIYNLKYALLIMILYFLLMELIFGKVCLFNIIFNIDCPGCGLTRATIALLKGDISSSLNYNPTCILWLLSIFLFIIDRYVKKLWIKPFPFIFIIVSIVTILWYFFIK